MRESRLSAPMSVLACSTAPPASSTAEDDAGGATATAASTDAAIARVSPRDASAGRDGAGSSPGGSNRRAATVCWVLSGV